MRNKPLKNMLNSISFKLIVGIFIFLVPLIILLIYNNNRSRQTLMAQVEDVHTNLLESYVLQIDSQLNGAKAYAVSLATNENAPLLIAYSQNEATVEYSRVSLNDNLQDKAKSGLLDGYFALITTRRGDENILIGTNSTSDVGDRAFMRGYLPQHADEVKGRPYTGDLQWTPIDVNGGDYLLLMVSNEEEIATGVYVNLRQMLIRMAGRESGLVIIPADKLDELRENTPGGTKLISRRSAQAPFAIAEFINESEILEALPFMQKYTLFVSFMLLLSIPAMLLLIHLIVSRPLQRLTDAMRRIEKGELDHRMEQVGDSSEIQIVNNTFNHMIDQIQNLKIDVYEQELKAQRSQLRNLQLQVRPHFLINSLNMVYNAVENENSALAKKLILYSVEYFRYMVKVEDDLVPLNEELVHVESYLEIQSIRYPENFSYSFDIDRLVEDVLIPPLTIQTFAENSIKYAIHLEHPVHIKIKVEYLEEDYAPFARITIADTGRGYPQRVLDAIEKGGAFESTGDYPDGRYIGIKNAIRRCDLIFEGRVKWNFYNSGGAVTSFVLPATFL